MGFLFDNLLYSGPKNCSTENDIENSETIEPANYIQNHYGSKIEELNVGNILKRYLRQTLKEILADTPNIDKIFLFEIRELLKKVTKRYDESDFPEFLELLNELFLICIDKEISNENNTDQRAEGEITENEPTHESIFMRFIQRRLILSEDFI